MGKSEVRLREKRKEKSEHSKNRMHQQANLLPPLRNKPTLCNLIVQKVAILTHPPKCITLWPNLVIRL